MGDRTGQNVLVVLVTVPTIEEGARIGELAVKSRLAACANIIPSIDSLFWWEGKISRAHEALILFKTFDDRYNALQELITEQHPYEVPEVIAIPVALGSPQYLGWVEKETRN